MAEALRELMSQARRMCPAGLPLAGPHPQGCLLQPAPPLRRLVYDSAILVFFRGIFSLKNKSSSPGWCGLVD